MDHFVITKASGEKVLFSVGKLKLSLRKSGASEAVIQEVIKQLEPTLYEGITTKKIYKSAFAILKKLSKPIAARYSLKKGIMQLGPSGFPFEKFVAELMRVQGYATQIGVFVDGHCVRHEIDVIASKDGKHNMIECKYHNLSRNKSDVKIPMYIYARFKDVEKVWASEKEYEVRFHQGWVVTNTRFTDDAIRYATCMQLHLMGWDYPAKGSLKDIVNSFSIYPITCLTTLSQTEKQNLLDMGIVLCRELQHNSQALHKAGVRDKRIDNISKEVDNLCDIV